MASRAEKLTRARMDALVAHLDATSGPASAPSLARSYAIDESKVTEILRKRGRLAHG